MNTTVTDAANDLLTLVERESEAAPYDTARVELDDCGVLVVRSFRDPRGVVMLGKQYRLVNTDTSMPFNRMTALRCLQAFLKREEAAAVREASELVGAM